MEQKILNFHSKVKKSTEELQEFLIKEIKEGWFVHSITPTTMGFDGTYLQSAVIIFNK